MTTTQTRTLKWASFNRFELQMPVDAVEACSHSGPCDADVAYWESRIERPASITPEKLAAELKEYGAWDDEELADDAVNWNRIVWLAAGNIKEEQSQAERNQP
jgi:hypothetical protein